MRRKYECTAITLVCLAVAAGMTGAKARTTHTEGGTLWVTERTTGGQSTVAAIDAATGDSLGIVGVGDNPIGITAPVGRNKVYSSDENADQVSVIDKDTFHVTQIPMGDKPHHLMASRDGRYVYVAQFGSNTVGVIDTQQDARLPDIVVSKKLEARTHAVWISGNGRYLYATNEDSSDATRGTFSKVDLRGEPGILWEVVVGNRPSEVLVDDDTAYVSVRNEHTVKVYDIGGPEPQYLGQAEASSEPDTLSLTNDKRTLIVGLRRSLLGRPARMAFIDVATLGTTYLELPPGTTTGHQWLSSNGRFTYIALEGRLATAAVSGSPGMIAVVDNRHITLVTTYLYPNQNIRPHGVFFESPRQDGLEGDVP